MDEQPEIIDSGQLVGGTLPLSDLSTRDLLIMVMRDVSEMKVKLTRFEEREKVEDRDGFRKQTCPWGEVLTGIEHQLSSGGRRFNDHDREVLDLKKRVAQIEKLVLTRETQASLSWRIFDWSWKAGVIALLAREILGALGIPGPGL